MQVCVRLWKDGKGKNKSKQHPQGRRLIMISVQVYVSSEAGEGQRPEEEDRTCEHGMPGEGRLPPIPIPESITCSSVCVCVRFRIYI